MHRTTAVSDYIHMHLVRNKPMDAHRLKLAVLTIMKPPESTLGPE